MRKEEWKIYKNVFDSFTLRELFKLSEHFIELHGQVSVGKEANVFSLKTKKGFSAIKIWRLDNSNFKNMFNYLIQDPRYLGLKRRKREIIFAWAQREYRNLLKAREVIKVPTPIAIRHHIIIMDFIGKQDIPALKLTKHPPEDPKTFYKQVIKDMKKLYKSGLIHGDLSPYNILNYEEQPVYIDFSQGTLTTAYNAEELLIRDIKVINKFFSKYSKTKTDEQLLKFIKD